jgi:hypothetical protein
MLLNKTVFAPVGSPFLSSRENRQMYCVIRVSYVAVGCYFDTAELEF